MVAWRCSGKEGSGSTSRAKPSQEVDPFPPHLTSSPSFFTHPLHFLCAYSTTSRRANETLRFSGRISSQSIEAHVSSTPDVAHAVHLDGSRTKLPTIEQLAR